MNRQVKYGDVGAVELLLAYGADPKLKMEAMNDSLVYGDDGDDAFDAADDKANKNQLVSLLKSAKRLREARGRGEWKPKHLR